MPQRLYIILILAFLLLACVSYGQEGQNPFEITTEPVSIELATPSPSLSEEETINTDSINESAILNTPAPVINGNPFDIDGSATPTTDASPSRKTNKPTRESINNKVAGKINSNFLFFLIVFMMVFFALIATFLRGFLLKVYEAFINSSQLNAIYREHGTSLSLPYLALYSLYFVNGTIFVYLLLDHYKINLGSYGYNLLLILGILLGIFAFKHLLLKFIAWVFPIDKEIDLLNFSIMIFNIIIGVILIPINLLLAYTPDSLTVGVIYSFGAIFIGIYLYRSLRSLIIGSRYLSAYKFHFFMYLCSVEIAPLVILVKFVKTLM